MSKNKLNPYAGYERISTDSVNSVAEQALIFLASRTSSSYNQLNELYLAQLHDASVGVITKTCLEVAETMMNDGVRPEDIADRYVPSVARKLGEEWNDDDLSFSVVSLGASRLQSLLRKLGPEWSADTAPNPLVTHSAALVIVTAEVHHTLGSMVLAGQLRRAGLSVRLSVGAETPEVVDLVRDGAFEAVMISASIVESIDSIKDIVDAIRSTVVPPPPIVVGGTILDQISDIQSLTGADLTTTDISEALEFCNLMSRASGRAAFLDSE